jgi:hypothetical protein
VRACTTVCARSCKHYCVRVRAWMSAGMCVRACRVCARVHACRVCACVQGVCARTRACVRVGACMRACLRAGMCACVRVRARMHGCMRAVMCMGACVRACVRACARVCARTRACRYVRTCVRAGMCARVCALVRACRHRAEAASAVRPLGARRRVGAAADRRREWRVGLVCKL